MRVVWSGGVGNNSVFVPLQFPPGNHQIEWEIGDACNLPIVCELPIQVDQLVATKKNGGVGYDLSCMPNPFRETAQLRFYQPENETFVWRLYSPTGAVLAEKVQTGAAGDQMVVISGALLGNNPGVYFFSLETRWGRAVERLVFIP